MGGTPLLVPFWYPMFKILEDGSAALFDHQFAGPEDVIMCNDHEGIYAR